jgi:hypothetical protein
MKTLNKIWISVTFAMLLFLSTAAIGSSHADTAMIGLGDIGDGNE